MATEVVNNASHDVMLFINFYPPNLKEQNLYYDRGFDSLSRMFPSLRLFILLTIN